MLVASVDFISPMANGFLVLHQGQVGGHGQVILAVQPGNGQLQVYVALSPEDDFVSVAVLFPG